MKKQSFFRSTVAAVMVAGIFAASAAHADTLDVMPDANQLVFSVTTLAGTVTDTAGYINVTSGNTRFWHFALRLASLLPSSRRITPRRLRSVPPRSGSLIKAIPRASHRLKRPAFRLLCGKQRTTLT